MTNANMKLVIVDVPFEAQLESPRANLDDGEFIVKKVVQLTELNDKLKGRVMYSHRKFEAN